MCVVQIMAEGTNKVRLENSGDSSITEDEKFYCYGCLAEINTSLPSDICPNCRCEYSEEMANQSDLEEFDQRFSSRLESDYLESSNEYQSSFRPQFNLPMIPLHVMSSDQQGDSEVSNDQQGDSVGLGLDTFVEHVLETLREDSFRRFGSAFSESRFRSQDSLSSWIEDMLPQLRSALNQLNPIAVTQSQIDALPQVTVRQKHLDVTAQCSICLEKFMIGETGTILPCNHIHHTYCIAPWLTLNGTCPICRHNLISSIGASSNLASSIGASSNLARSTEASSNLADSTGASSSQTSSLSELQVRTSAREAPAWDESSVETPTHRSLHAVDHDSLLLVVDSPPTVEELHDVASNFTAHHLLHNIIRILQPDQPNDRYAASNDSQMESVDDHFEHLGELSDDETLELDIEFSDEETQTSQAGFRDGTVLLNVHGPTSHDDIDDHMQSSTADNCMPSSTTCINCMLLSHAGTNDHMPTSHAGTNDHMQTSHAGTNDHMQTSHAGTNNHMPTSHAGTNEHMPTSHAGTNDRMPTTRDDINNHVPSSRADINDHNMPLSNADINNQMTSSHANINIDSSMLLSHAGINDPLSHARNNDHTTDRTIPTMIVQNIENYVEFD